MQLPDRAWYEADVIETRTEPHKIKGHRVLAREIFCRYLLDGVEKWHSLHNNRVRARTMMALGAMSLNEIQVHSAPT